MKLVSYNVGMVNPEAEFLYVDGLVRDVFSLDADIVALHEFEKELCPRLDDALRARYPFVHYLERADKGYSCALFSRWQMDDVRELLLGDGFEDMPDKADEEFIRKVAVTDEEKTEAGKRGVIGATVVKPDGSRVKIITCHLMSNGFNQLLIYDGMSPWKRFPLFWKRFMMSCDGRNTETRYLHKWVVDALDEGLPVVVCGDTNSFWWSRAIKTICGRELKDAFVSVAPCYVVGWLKRWLSTLGYGHTLYAHKVMYFRLDYVLHSAGVQVISYNAPHWKYSDHYPVVVEMDV